MANHTKADVTVVLLAWNRDAKDTWPVEDYDDARLLLLRGELYETTWSVGRRRNIVVGTPCFLYVQGEKHSRGLVGLGTVVGEPYEDDHFRVGGATSNYVEIEWQGLLPLDDLIPLRELLRHVPDGPWAKGFRQSGHPLHGKTAQQLLDLWHDRTPESEETEAGEISDGGYIEGAVRTIKVNRYERDPRARRIALEHHGHVCAVCDLDPVRVYGPGIGTRVIHVHHITPMSQIGEEYELDPINDLIPLCPNCHNAIHKLTPVPTPKKFRAQITQGL
jgi:5-methylcytosine-specific restriction protein A